MSIKISNNKSKMPEGLKLASKICTYLFEQQYRELDYMSSEEIETLRKAGNILIKASNRTIGK